MSYSCDDGYVSVYNERDRKARKEHECCACKRRIMPREVYTRVALIWEGTVRPYKRCAGCQATHEHLRELCEGRDLWPEERLDCGKSYEDEWGELPQHIAALAFATPSEQAEILARVREGDG